MDRVTGDVPGGDVLVSGGAIAAVGTGLAAPAGGRVIDATGMLVAPGPGGYALAHVEHAVARHVRNGPRIFRLCRGQRGSELRGAGAA
jgi:predicted amidohydrolase